MRIITALLISCLLCSSHLRLMGQYILNVKQTFHETDHQIYFTGYSDKGNYIITTGSDNNILLWNAETGIVYRTLAGLKKRSNDACFLEDQERLYSGGEDNLITVWNTGTMSVEATFSGHQGPVKAIDVSPDGKLLASGGSDQSVRLWDIRKTSLIYEMKAHKKEVTALDFSPDGKMLASGSADDKLILWNVSSGGIIGAVDAHKGWIRDVCFSPDGKFIASCGNDRMIRIWTVPGLDEVKTLKGHRNWVQSIDYSPDGRFLMSGGHDQLILLWDVEQGKLLCQSEKQGQIVLSVDIHPLYPDFISARLLSEDLMKWAISGPDITQWKIPSTVQQSSPETASGTSGDEMQYPRIEVLSPVFRDNRCETSQGEILIIGRVEDPAGMPLLLLNGNPVAVSETGIFQINLDLRPGENSYMLLASNPQGKRTEKSLVVDCTLEGSVFNAAPGTEDIGGGSYFALLIGINEYADEGIIDLDNPVHDMENLYQVLHTRYNFDEENITLLKNPTRNDLIIALDRLGGRLGKNDNLLIFYAGHGYWDSKGKIGYWLPSDADMHSTVNWFRNSTLRDYIGSIDTRHTLLIADACFSGAIFKTRGVEEEASRGIQKLYELPSRKAMTSGILQEVPDESVFLKYLVERLEKNEEKYLSSEALFSSFKTAVMNNSPNVPQYGTIQNVGDEGGDYIFIRR
jgi:hypothetical protein